MRLGEDVILIPRFGTPQPTVKCSGGGPVQGRQQPQWAGTLATEDNLTGGYRRASLPFRVEIPGQQSTEIWPPQLICLIAVLFSSCQALEE